MGGGSLPSAGRSAAGERPGERLGRPLQLAGAQVEARLADQQLDALRFSLTGGGERLRGALELSGGRQHPRLDVLQRDPQELRRGVAVDQLGAHCAQLQRAASGRAGPRGRKCERLQQVGGEPHGRLGSGGGARGAGQQTLGALELAPLVGAQRGGEVRARRRRALAPAALLGQRPPPVS